MPRSSDAPRPPPAESAAPEARPHAVVAIVGRPNVGKSTLFNRLVGRRRAIVHDLPGVTRDRIVETAQLGDDTEVEVVDTGGLVPSGDDALGLGEQVQLAIDESDALVLVVDGRAGPVAGDELVLAALRRSGKPIVLAVNKGDVREAREGVGEFHRFGLEPILVSAEHGTGMERLAEQLEAVIAELPAPTSAAAAGPTVAIVGRPNVGKSSLLNRLVGAERVLVSAEPGTTRDPIDTLVTWEGRPFVLVDTAGIRRRSKVSGAPEDLAVMMAQRQIERAEAALLVIDAAQGVTTGDLAIAGVIRERARACVVVCNKWDLLAEGAEQDAGRTGQSRRDRLEDSWQRLDELLSGPARVNVSAVSGRGVERIFPRLEASLEVFHREIETSVLNAVLERAAARHHAPSVKGRPWKVFYGSQVGTAPPTFMLFATTSLPQHSSQRRFLENFLRRELDLGGVPIRLVIRKRH